MAAVTLNEVGDGEGITSLLTGDGCTVIWLGVLTGSVGEPTPAAARRSASSAAAILSSSARTSLRFNTRLFAFATLSAFLLSGE